MNLRFFPNSITLLNLFIGCIVVLLLVENNIEVKYVFVLSVICLVLDFLDGYIARKLNAKSELGLQLDSLADMVSLAWFRVYFFTICFLTHFIFSRFNFFLFCSFHWFCDYSLLSLQIS